MFSVETEAIIKVVLYVTTIIISLLVFVYKTVVEKKIDTILLDIKDNNNLLQKKLDKTELDIKENITKYENKLDKFKDDIDDKLSNHQDEIYRKIEMIDVKFDKKIEKFELEMRLVNKEIIIIQNENKFLNKRLNKLDGFDSTNY